MAIPQPIRMPMRAVYRRVQAEVLVGRIALHTLDTDLMTKGREMQCLSRRSFGWTTPHRTRWWEYPWILREVERRMSGRAMTALDAGAGKSPMPIALAELGLKTTVADPNSQEQTGKNSSGEWDWTALDTLLEHRSLALPQYQDLSPDVIDAVLEEAITKVIEETDEEKRRRRNRQKTLNHQKYLNKAQDLQHQCGYQFHRILGLI